LASPLTAVQIADFDTLTNDRFANDGSFVADQFDLSGVGLNGRWATMISENVYITAEHFAPTVGSSMTFYASNDPNGPSVTRSITSNRQQIGSSDIFVGTLDSALPSGFSFYDFATEDITGAPGGPGSFSQSSYNGVNAYVFGKSPTAWPTSQNMAVGRNELGQFFSGISAAGNSGDGIGGTDDTGTVNAVTYEAQLEVGDSGGPLFVENGEGGLTIVGANWFIGTSGGEDIFGASYFGNYDEDIQAFVDANVVPEPGTFSLLLSIACGFAALRRKP
jgi:hypothetical protein